MARYCVCTRKCRHLVPSGSESLIPPRRLLQLERVLGILADAADAFDADRLHFDPECGVHGAPTGTSECICRGDFVSALEFVEALQVDVRSAGLATRVDHADHLRDGQQARRASESVASA